MPSDRFNQQEIEDHNMEGEDFPDEDFDNLPLDEFDVVFQESAKLADDSRRSTRHDNDVTGNPNEAKKRQTAMFEQNTPNGSGSLLGPRSTTKKVDYGGCSRGVTGQSAAQTSSAASVPSCKLRSVTNESDFMDEDMDFLLREGQPGRAGEPDQLPLHQGHSRDRESASKTLEISSSICTSDSSRNITPQRQNYTPNTAEFDRVAAKKGPQSHCSVPALTLTSPPFTYLCLLEEMMSKPDFHTTEIHLKAFIVTLLGKLSSNNGLWRICATISDGSGYLDVELSDEVLTGLLGFSVAEKGALRRDPARRGELDTGMKKCQEELVDMCCVMTIVIEPEGRKAVVTKAEPVSEKVLQHLEQRVRDGRK